MNIGALIIGDEILSGKRTDRHFSQVVETLAQRGLELSWCRILGDVPGRIIANLRETLATGDLVFSFGGIGATPDDHTRLCAARAAQVDLVRHPEAVAEIEAQFGAEAYPRRILLADLPQGSRIIPNPFNRVPGFSLDHHHFLPGFPQMAWPMMEWVLDQRYPELRGAPPVEEIITVHGAMESHLLELMQQLVETHPAVRFSSLPHIGDDGRWLELGIRGTPSQVTPAMDFLKAGITRLGFRFDA